MKTKTKKPQTFRKNFVFRKDEFEIIKKAADEAHITVSHFVRACCLEKAKADLAKRQSDISKAAFLQRIKFGQEHRV
jgi:uncharacterized protein (DUF1778 family)